MPTIGQCKTFVADYQLLGLEADISIQRATALMGISRSWTSLAPGLTGSEIERGENSGQELASVGDPFEGPPGPCIRKCG